VLYHWPDADVGHPGRPWQNQGTASIVSRSLTSFLPTAQMLAPCAASANAMARPIPLLRPVITATPSSDFSDEGVG